MVKEKLPRQPADQTDLLVEEALTDPNQSVEITNRNGRVFSNRDIVAMGAHRLAQVMEQGVKVEVWDEDEEDDDDDWDCACDGECICSEKEELDGQKW